MIFKSVHFMSITVLCFFQPVVIAPCLFFITIYDRALLQAHPVKENRNRHFHGGQAANQNLFFVRIANGENGNAASTSQAGGNR
jgi:hypothetical protein